MKVSALILLITFSTLARCLAGTTGVMNGYVRDDNGDPSASVLVTIASPGDMRSTLTDEHGFFVFLALPPGLYSVDARKRGGLSATASGARINSDQTTFLTFHFNRWLGCPGTVSVTIASDRRSTQFSSVDLQLVDAYPPNTAPPIFLPIAPRPHYTMCL